MVRRALLERASPGWKPGALPLSERLIWCRRQGTLAKLARSAFVDLLFFKQVRRPTTPQRQTGATSRDRTGEPPRYQRGALPTELLRHQGRLTAATKTGARGRTRTGTDCSTAPSTLRVSQISPLAHWCGSQGLNLHGPRATGV
jgi:hypothetical protein